MTVACGEDHDRNDLLAKLIEMQYERTEMDLLRGKFRPRGDSLEIYPSYAEYAYRIEFFGDQIDRIDLIDPLTGRTLKIQQNMVLYPAKHYVVPEDNTPTPSKASKKTRTRLRRALNPGQLLEAQRSTPVPVTMEMIQEVGYCSGIENYSRHLSGRAPGSKPYTLIDYFPKDFLLVIDESHVTIPQIRAMYAGDRHRKDVLVEHGFRLPSALDNRPLTFDEFESVWKKVVFVSATPAPYELTKSGGEFVEQIIRPTGLIDPVIHVLPARGQVEHLLGEIKKRVARQERILVTTLTKKMSEDLAQYIREENISCNYLHSEVETLERVEILKDLRLGKYDVIVGVNLLREGLDLPEVSMVAILDSDKQGFLRSPTSLIQMIGRAARNVNAEVFLYADKITPAMQQAIDETERRRKIQEQYNRENNYSADHSQAIRDGLETEITARKLERDVINIPENDYEQEEIIRMLEQEMYEAARNMEFEKAALIRDKLMEVRKQTNLGISPMVPESQRKTSAAKPKFKRNSKKSR